MNMRLSSLQFCITHWKTQIPILYYKIKFQNRSRIMNAESVREIASEIITK